jgi:heterotetrameric sarcosine oxidase beta subunit
VETNRGFIGAKKVGVAVAGSSSKVMAHAGMRLPIESHVLQAFVSEGLKPLIDGVMTFGAGHFYVSQSDKGGLVFGGDIDGYNSYAQRGNLPVIEDVAEGGMALMPAIGRARLLRTWGGIMDMSMDGSPIIDKTHVDGPLFQRRLVLWRVQGDPGLGLVLCASAGERRTAQDRDGLSLRPVPSEKGQGAEPDDCDEKGQGAQPNLQCGEGLEGKIMIIQSSDPGAPRRAGIRLSGRRQA